MRCYKSLIIWNTAIKARRKLQTIIKNDESNKAYLYINIYVYLVEEINKKERLICYLYIS